MFQLTFRTKSLLFCFYPFKKKHPRQDRIKVTEFKGILTSVQWWLFTIFSLILLKTTATNIAERKDHGEKEVSADASV